MSSFSDVRISVSFSGVVSSMNLSSSESANGNRTSFTKDMAVVQPILFGWLCDWCGVSSGDDIGLR